MTTSATVQTIADQIAPTVWGWPVALFTKDDHTLRVHVKTRGKVHNVDISYDAAHDLYDVNAYSFLRRDILKFTEQEWHLVYADSLRTILESVTGLNALGIK